MNCREFSGYLFYCLPTYEADLLPPETQDHLEVCSECRAKVTELRAAFKLLRKKEKKLARQAKKAVARVKVRVLERLKSGDLPEVLDVDCQKVQPLLALAADPLELMDLPSWLDEHLALCEDCQREFQRLEEFSDIIVVAEMPVLAQEVIADAPPEFMEKVHKRRAIILPKNWAHDF